MLVVDTPFHTVQDVVDIVGRAWETGAGRIAVPVERLDAAFFTLGSGVAGAIMQKFTDYRLPLAVVGDITDRLAASASLRAFVAEANRRVHLWFVRDLGLLGLRTALDDHVPRDAIEAADVRRVRVLLATERTRGRASSRCTSRRPR